MAFTDEGVKFLTQIIADMRSLDQTPHDPHGAPNLRPSLLDFRASKVAAAILFSGQALHKRPLRVRSVGCSGDAMAAKTPIFRSTIHLQS